jgi:signal transduction histidine kinase
MLVVDDDPRSRKLLEGFLRSEDYDVRCAPDGPTALRLASELPPDVVLLDVMMPGMTGYQVCEVLKSRVETRLCQVMMVTALDGTPDKVEGLDIGADDYVTKPVRREEFLAKVRALIRARRLMAELETARTELTRRNEELELKKTLAQSLVHDLKSPLTAIAGNIELLEMRCDPKLRHLTDRSKRSAKRMQEMIMNLLDVEGLEAGKLAPTIGRVDLVQTVEASLEDAEVSAQQARVHLESELPDEAWVAADLALLQRVVDNLLSNAIAHTPTDGRVEVTVRQREEGLELAVADSGAGVSEAHREQIFEKYARVTMGRTQGSLNRGLGLSFCGLVVEALGGAIWVEEATIGGACFRVVLPDTSAIEASEPVPANAGAS